MTILIKMLIAVAAVLASIGCFVTYLFVHSPLWNLIGIGLFALGLFGLQSAIRHPRQ